MDKKVGVIIALVAIVVVAGGGIVAYSVMNKNKAPSISAQEGSRNTVFLSKQVDACKVLNTDVAASYLGETPDMSDAPSSQTSSDDVAVSNCSYVTKYAVGQPDGSMRSASLFARSAKTEEGAKSNKSQFGEQKPADAQDVSGYGDSAYWAPAYGQLNILKHHNWYIISAGSTNITKRTVDDARKLADSIVDRL